MADLHVLTGLIAKRAEISRKIAEMTATRGLR
jgi:hypothetical protein